jgi:predicted AlkP superfamily phosphohydrolase/phosphomutase
MKTLVFGIDGLGKETLEVLRLTRLQNRLGSGQTFNAKVDANNSRGWPEIYLGKNAFETGSFYQVPCQHNGKTVTNQSTGYGMLKASYNDEFLWNILSKNGLKTGLFMVPTVSGDIKDVSFYVGATGAGNFSGGLTNSDVSNWSQLKFTVIQDVDYALRLGYGGFLPSSIDQLVDRINTHISSYFYLLNKSISCNELDFLFVGTRLVNEIGYKFFEVLRREPLNYFEEKLKSALLSILDSFDLMLDQFLNTVNAEHLFIVSDHGIGAYKYDVNLNEMLLDYGYLKRDKSIESFGKDFVKKTLFLLGYREYGPIKPRYNYSAEVFGCGYTGCIYINDDRFSNIVSSKERRNEIIFDVKNRLIQTFEDLGFEKALDIKIHDGGVYETGIPKPDISLRFPYGVNNSCRTKKSFVNLHHDDTQSMFSKGFYGEHSGCKSDDTLVGYIGSSSVAVNKLTDVYNEILRVSK